MPAFQDREKLHGAGMLRLIERARAVSIEFLSNIHPSLYEIRFSGSEAIVLLKHSTKARSPWQFTMTSQEAGALRRAYHLHGQRALFVAFVCGQDGVCCVHLSILEAISPADTIGESFFSIRRPPAGSYWISGPGRTKHERSIPMQDWPDALGRGGIA